MHVATMDKRRLVLCEIFFHSFDLLHAICTPIDKIDGTQFRSKSPVFFTIQFTMAKISNLCSLRFVFPDLPLISDDWWTGEFMICFMLFLLYMVTTSLVSSWYVGCLNLPYWQSILLLTSEATLIINALEKRNHNLTIYWTPIITMIILVETWNWKKNMVQRYNFGLFSLLFCFLYRPVTLIQSVTVT